MAADGSIDFVAMSLMVVDVRCFMTFILMCLAFPVFWPFFLGSVSTLSTITSTLAFISLPKPDFLWSLPFNVLPLNRA